jgi:hypothetical protein
MKLDAKYLIGPILIPLVFFLPELIGRTVLAGFDFTHLILPFQEYARSSLSHGELPHWNPYLFGGFPQIAEGEGGLFYPGNALLWLPFSLTTLLAWTVALHLVLAGLLMYGFLRSRGASRASASWLAMFYQFLPGIILRTETVGLFEAMAWIPGVYWAIERGIESGMSGKSGSWLGWTLFGSAQIGFMLLAGSSQIAFYTMVGSVFFIGGLVAMGPRARVRLVWAVAIFLMISAFGAMLAAVQLLPTSVLASLSYRVQSADFEYYRLGTWLNFPRLASLFIFPAVGSNDEILDYITSLAYIGLLPFLLVGVCLSLHRRHMNPILPPFFLVFFGLLLAFGFNWTANLDLVTFPGFNLFRAMGRMSLPVVVGFFALASVGLDGLFNYFEDSARRRLVKSGIWVTGAVGFGLAVWFFIYGGMRVSEIQLLGLRFLGTAFTLVAVCVVLYLWTRKPAFLTGLLALWLAAEIVSVLPAKTVMTVTADSFASLGESAWTRSLAKEDHGGRPPRVLIGRDADVWESLITQIKYNPFTPGLYLPVPAFGNELSLYGVGVLNAYTPLIGERWFEMAQDYAAKGLSRVSEASPRLRNVLAMCGVDAIAAPWTFDGGEGVVDMNAGVAGNLFPDGWHVVRTPSVAPFIGIAGHVDFMDKPDWIAFKDWIGQPEYVPGEWAAVEMSSEELDGLGLEDYVSAMNDAPANSFVYASMDLPAESDSEILSRSVTSTTISVDVRADYPYWLIVRTSFMPGWTASVDGNPARIYPADWVFCGIPLPIGEHSVVMNYRTPRLDEGGRISIIAWSIWAVLLLSILIRSIRPNAKHV